ncbi:MAG: riboflavin synthase [Acidobacteriota bacterium]|nr:MAG: riboflavin synthase [Acidobacteriota bacterium]
MFTGLVEGLGRIVASRPRARGLCLGIEHELASGPLQRGESVAVDGCCLTVVATAGRRFGCDLSPETLARTGGAGHWVVSRPVNLERAIRAGDRLGGHIVQGHLDGTLRVLSWRRHADGSATGRFSLPQQGAAYIVEKGSVALDGVSLTVAAIGPEWFEVAFIPATLAATTFGKRRPGELVGVEYDILAKYAERAVEAAARRAAGSRAVP